MINNGKYPTGSQCSKEVWKRKCECKRRECVSLFDTSEWSGNTQKARKKQEEIMLTLKNYIDSHERGNEVYKPKGVDFKPSDGGCSVIM